MRASESVACLVTAAASSSPATPQSDAGNSSTEERTLDVKEAAVNDDVTMTTDN